jgi:hypothetical protein
VQIFGGAAAPPDMLQMFWFPAPFLFPFSVLFFLAFFSATSPFFFFGFFAPNFAEVKSKGIRQEMHGFRSKSPKMNMVPFNLASVASPMQVRLLI